jgi:transposase
MSHVLEVIHQQSIQSLHQKGWSCRRIARELGIDRRTVAHYARVSKCASISTAGSAPSEDAKCAISTPGISQGASHDQGVGAAAGRKSHCEALAELITAKMELGLSAQRIYQDLVVECAFAGSYQSVKRYVRAQRKSQPRRIWRMECEPGEELQVDFGLGAPLKVPDGKTKRTWVLRAVLSYSRKGYSEAVLRQDTETFLRCLENALRHFGGVPQLLNLDNLKAAVLKADWYDPQLNPKLREFCRHYGMDPMPCRPYHPQHKGKVERGVGYVKSNALKGRSFKSLAEQNAFLRHWETQVADKRIHGTTCQQVAARFAQEQPHLQPLPAAFFPCYQEARRSVNRDSFVEVAKAYYEAPPEFIGQQVWVRWDSRTVRLYNQRMEQVQMHLRQEPGRYSRILGAVGLSQPVRVSCDHWIKRAALLGEACKLWAQRAVEVRGPEALRSLMGLCALNRKHSAAAIQAACAKALMAGTPRLRDVQRLIKQPLEQGHFPFAQSHPLIRDLNIYAEFIGSAPQNTKVNTDPKPNPPHHEPPHPTQDSRPQAATLGAA